jgi:ribosome-associated heat shock protein Hsp15
MTVTSLRLDVFLHRARFFKTRSLAANAVSSSGVRIERDGMTRRIDKPSTQVCIGDKLSFSKKSVTTVLNVLSLPHRRGPANEASICYDILQN